MSQRTIYLLNALGLITLVALNAINELGIGKALFIPAAWFIGAWYGRMDEQATWTRLLGEKVKAAMPTSMDWVNTNRAAQPAPVMRVDQGCGDDRSVAALVTMSGAGCIEVVDEKDLDPLDAEKAMAELNATLQKYGLPPQNQPPRACND